MRAPDTKPGSVAARGFAFLMVTSVGWGLNFPVMKFILTEWPPLSARGLSGIVGALGLALLAVLLKQDLRLPRELLPRIVGISLLTITSWAAFMGLALVWLRGSEAAVVAASMPVWVSLLALVILKEHFSPLRAVALFVGLSGLAILFGTGGFEANAGKWPGIAFAFAGTVCVALGTVLTKRLPFHLPPISLAAWQIGVGCVPVAIAGLLIEHPQPAALSPGGWAAMAYLTFVQFCICYACWFAALQRLPASTASIGTLMVPVVGVLSSGALLGEPLGVREFAALGLTLGGVVLAARS
jgi:drug/metabolite transporter (DMT)-like permease